MDLAEKFDADEQRHLAAAPQDLPALAIARRATGALAEQIDGAQTPPAPEKPTPSFYIREATLLLAVIGLRTARACVLVVSAGYSPEAHGLKRRLSEVHARAQAVVDDGSGQHARDWLENKGASTPPRIVGKYGNLDLWKLYSWGAHADAQSVQQWLTVPMPDIAGGHQGLLVVPHFDEQLSNALLVECAMECRDLAMAQAVGREGITDSITDETLNAIRARQTSIRELDSKIDVMRERYYARGDAPDVEAADA
jgi:hypothetical protein